MFNKIQNPITGNWVNTNGIIGKKILRNYISQNGGGSKKKTSARSRAASASKRRKKRKHARKNTMTAPTLVQPKFKPRESCDGQLREGYEPISIASGLDISRPFIPNTPPSVRERYNQSIELPRLTSEELLDRTDAAISAEREETTARHLEELRRARDRYHLLLKRQAHNRRKNTCPPGTIRY